MIKILEAIEPVDNIQEMLRAISYQNLDLSPTNVNILMDNYFIGRSSLNSPKIIDNKSFSFANI